VSENVHKASLISLLSAHWQQILLIVGDFTNIFDPRPGPILFTKVNNSLQN